MLVRRVALTQVATQWVRWSAQHKCISLVVAGGVGVLMCAPFVVANWQALQTSLEAQDQIAIEKMDVEALEQQIQRLEAQIDILKNEHKLLNHQSLGKVLSDLQRLAHQEGLVVNHFSSVVQETQNTSHPKHLKQQVLNFQVKGSWAQWQKWSDQVQQSVPNVYLSGLNMSSDQGQGAVIHMRYVVPYEDIATPAAWGLAGIEQADTSARQEPLDAQRWQQAQQVDYWRRTATGLPKLAQHPLHPLEKIPLQAIEYVGQIANPSKLAAVLRLKSGQAAESSIFILRVGDFLGKDLGQIVDIKPHELVLRELVLDTSGAWLARTVKLPLANKTAL